MGCTSHLGVSALRHVPELKFNLSTDFELFKVTHNHMFVNDVHLGHQNVLDFLASDVPKGFVHETNRSRPFKCVDMAGLTGAPLWVFLYN